MLIQYIVVRTRTNIGAADQISVLDLIYSSSKVGRIVLYHIHSGVRKVRLKNEPKTIIFKSWDSWPFLARPAAFWWIKKILKPVTIHSLVNTRSRSVKKNQI